MKYPFEASFEEVQSNLDTFVSVVFSSLESEFLILPKGSGFVDYCDREDMRKLLLATRGKFSP